MKPFTRLPTLAHFTWQVSFPKAFRLASVLKPNMTNQEKSRKELFVYEKKRMINFAKNTYTKNSTMDTQVFAKQVVCTSLHHTSIFLVNHSSVTVALRHTKPRESVQLTSKPANCQPCALLCCWELCAWMIGVAFSRSQVAEASSRPDIA